jgi:hypothetical protein
VIEDPRSGETVDAPATSEDPAGEVMVPPGRRAIVGAQILAGAVVGLNTIFGALADITSPQA